MGLETESGVIRTDPAGIRRVRGQPFEVDSAFQAADVFLHQFGPVRGQPIPNDQQAAGNPLQQMP